MIYTEHLNRVYKKGSNTIVANNDISFTVPEGSFTTIVGKSGSGKSTLLNLLGGLDTPTSGVISFFGKDISQFSKKELSRHRREMVGIIFQSFNLVYSKTALENVLLPLAFSGVNKSSRVQKATETLTAVGLKHRLQHKANELSGGEAQRVAIARALINNPKVLLADEPTGNLDSATTEEILQIMMNLKQEGKTIIMITHDLEIAQKVSDKIYTIKDGQLS